MPNRRTAELDGIALLALLLAVVHGAGVAPTGAVAAALLAGTAGHRVGRWATTGAPVGPVLRAGARRIVPLLILVTLGYALQARLTGDDTAYAALRGSTTWLWLGFADVHAMVWRAAGWDAGTYDPAAGTWLVAAAARPALLWLGVAALTRGDVERQRRIAQIGLGCCAAAALLWLPGGDDARRYYSPELTTAASLLGILLATAAAGPSARLELPTVRLPVPLHGDLLVLAAALWLTPVFGALTGVDAGVGLLVLSAIALIAPAVATAFAADVIGSSSASDETLAVLLPPAAVVAMLVLWQATGSFGYAPPTFV